MRRDEKDFACRGGYYVKTHMVYTLCNNMVYTQAKKFLIFIKK